MIDFDKAFEELDEMLENGKEINLFEVVRKEIQEKESYINEDWLKRGKIWSEIGNQIV